MNHIEHCREKLLEKEREFQSDLAAFEAEGIVSGKREAGVSTDDAAVSQSISEAFEEGTIVSQGLEEVQDALRRIGLGTYGKCAVCGREIEPDRLESIPWASYCLEDQKRQDKALPAWKEGGTCQRRCKNTHNSG
jgi:RNA polymerase-binding transcription factor DksA